MSRRFYVNRDRAPVSSCPSYSPGKYSAEYIDNLVFALGWIPVASAAEFDKIRTGNLEDMGVGTCWEGKYTTGGDKKYVQVNAIDFASFGSWTSAVSLFTGIYDGNELGITSLSGTTGLFNSGVATIKNMRLVSVSISATGSVRTGAVTNKIEGGELSNITVSGSVSNVGGNDVGGIASGALLAGELSADLTILNCTNNADVSGAIRIAGVIAGAGISGVNTVTINNCINNGNINCTGRQAGGIASRGINLIVTNCENNGNITGGANEVGGIIGNALLISTFTLCENNGDLTGAQQVGGIIGNSRGSGQRNVLDRCLNNGNIIGTIRVGGISGWVNADTVDECKNTGDVTGTSIVGGIFGNLENTSSTVTIMNNLESSGLITNSGSETGGLIGRDRWGGSTLDNSIAYCAFAGSTTLRGGLVGRQFAGSITSTASYWDTTIGPATSAAGTGKTTSELQTPISNTGIYSAWTIPPWDFGASNEYPTLTTTP